MALSSLGLGLQLGGGGAPYVAPITKNVFWLGNSLLGTPDGGGGVNCSVGYMVGQIAESLGHNYTFKRQIENGVTLKSHWSTGGYGPDDVETELLTGNYDVLVMQEMIPLQQHITFSAAINKAGQFHDLNTASHAVGRSIYYGSWSAYTDDGSNGTVNEDFVAPRDVWTYRITDDEATWQSVVDGVNNAGARAAQNFPLDLVYIGKKYLLPMDAAMPLTGLANMGAAFRDGTHPDTPLYYYIALAMCAEIYDIDIRGASYSFDSEGSLDGTPMTGLPGATLAGELQDLVYTAWAA